MGTNAVSDLRHSRRLFWYADAHHAGDERTSSITNNRRNCSVTRVCQHLLYIHIGRFLIPAFRKLSTLTIFVIFVFQFRNNCLVYVILGINYKITDLKCMDDCHL